MKMNKATLKALRASIKHWEENVAAETPENASVDAAYCALCRKFYKDHLCIGCPVMTNTGFSCCENSPYENANDKLYDWEIGGSRANWRRAAKKELEFLKSLLPQESEQ